MSRASISRPSRIAAGRVVGVVGVDHDARCRSPIARRTVSHSRDIVVEAKAELQFDAGEALGDALARLLDQIGERVAAALAVEPGRVGLDPVAQRPAEQPRHRHAEMPALQIPQRDVDRATAPRSPDPSGRGRAAGCRGSASAARWRARPRRSAAACRYSTIGAVSRAGPNASPQPLLPSSPTISTRQAPRRSYHACE